MQRGSARKTVNLPVPIAGKTGTTNDAKDVWFVGFLQNIVAGCYIGYDNPRSMGEALTVAAMCGPVFNQFMTKAIKKYGGGKFNVPPIVSSSRLTVSLAPVCLMAPAATT